MKKKYLFLLITALFTSFSYGQGLLNKLKNKANQEVNKLEKGATPTAQTQGTTPGKNKLGTNVTRTVLVKLHDDEAFDYSENCIDLGSSLDQASFMLFKRTESSNQCYSYQNGARKPIACPTSQDKACHETSLQCSFSKLIEITDSEEIKKYVTVHTTTSKIAQPKIPDAAMKQAEAFMTPAEKAEMEKQLKEAAKQGDISYSTITGSTINFNGKNYPVYTVNKFYVSPDYKNFYAQVQEDMKQPGYKIITSASATFFKSSIPVLDIFASPDNSEFAIYEMTMEQKYQISTSTGKTYPISGPANFKGAWYSPTGNHIMTYLENALYLDGILAKNFDGKEEYKPCDLFISSDGKGVTTIKEYVGISFADGDYFEHPLKVVIINAGRKAYYKWLALEKNELAVYQKPY